MLRKLASLLLSMILCLSLLPGQARAANLPSPDNPSVNTEPLDPETPDEPEPPKEPIIPLCEEEEVPEPESSHHT